MDSICFNCYNPGHQSIRCPEPPNYTKCYLCKKFCQNPDDHYWACDNRDFVSQKIYQPGKAVRSGQLVAHIKFFVRGRLEVMDGTNTININDDTIPMQINANHGLLLGDSKEVKYYQWHPDENHRCVVNIQVDQIVRLSIRFTKNFFVINKKIRVRTDGRIEYRNDAPNDEILPAEVTFNVAEQSQKFKLSIYAFGQSFSFEISRDQIKYLAPGWIGIECPICYESMVEKNGLMTPCCHLFCTTCLYRSLLSREACPICREKVTFETVRNIFLHN